jgi:hypothetical protein
MAKMNGITGLCILNENQRGIKNFLSCASCGIPVCIY